MLKEEAIERQNGLQNLEGYIKQHLMPMDVVAEVEHVNGL